MARLTFWKEWAWELLQYIEWSNRRRPTSKKKKAASNTTTQAQKITNYKFWQKIEWLVCYNSCVNVEESGGLY